MLDALLAQRLQQEPDPAPERRRRRRRRHRLLTRQRRRRRRRRRRRPLLTRTSGPSRARRPNSILFAFLPALVAAAWGPCCWPGQGLLLQPPRRAVPELFGGARGAAAPRAAQGPSAGLGKAASLGPGFCRIWGTPPPPRRPLPAVLGRTCWGRDRPCGAGSLRLLCGSGGLPWLSRLMQSGLQWSLCCVPPVGSLPRRRSQEETLRRTLPCL
ncbi:uncharacterized protein LOC133759023 [Lepus europaeus]|uniref:uncharacterized protein LOC133759023 n=1 Tax=Lepus europaeus TaxID=9983 RepID=UPI002B45D4B4|nr:uncharacterized protein LOC133759023 [Lepus europaeus]